MPTYDEVSRFEPPRRRIEEKCARCGGPLATSASKKTLLEIFGELICDRCQRPKRGGQ